MVRPGEQNEELRHSLRSLVHLPHDRAWIVGHRPAWVADNVGYVGIAGVDSKHENTWAAWWTMAFGMPEVSDEFILMNDDFFIMSPMGRPPTQHAGPLDAWLPALGNIRTRDRMEHTRAALHAMRPDRAALLSYELHVPMVLDRAALREVMVSGEAYRNSHLAPPLCKRTLYGNYVGVGGELAPDPKVRDTEDMAPRGTPVVSTSDRTWLYGEAGVRLRKTFSEPGAYERDRPAMPRSSRKGSISAHR